MKRNELFVTVSILVSIISLIFLNKALNKIQCTNHLTFKECGKKIGRKEKRGRRKEKRGGRKEKRGGRKAERSGRKEKRRGRKEKTTPCPPPRISKKNRQHKEKVQTEKQHIYVLGISILLLSTIFFRNLELFRLCGIVCFDFISG